MIHADLLVQAVARERAAVDRCNAAIRESHVLIENSKALRDKCAATRSELQKVAISWRVDAGILCRWPRGLAS